MCFPLYWVHHCSNSLLIQYSAIPNSKQFIAMDPLDALERARMTSVGINCDLLVAPYYLYTFNKHLRSLTFLNETWSAYLVASVSQVNSRVM